MDRVFQPWTKYILQEKTTSYSNKRTLRFSLSLFWLVWEQMRLPLQKYLPNWNRYIGVFLFIELRLWCDQYHSQWCLKSIGGYNCRDMMWKQKNNFLPNILKRCHTTQTSEELLGIFFLKERRMPTYHKQKKQVTKKAMTIGSANSTLDLNIIKYLLKKPSKWLKFAIIHKN